MSNVLRDLGLAVRSLMRTPGYAAITILTLALGIGATTAIFSVANAVLLRPLPYPGSERLTDVRTVFASGYAGRFSYPDFEDVREQNRTFSGLAAYSDWSVSAATAEQAFRVTWAQVSPGFLSVVGVQPAPGRGFMEDEERTGSPVAVVSYGYWQKHLGGRPNLAGQNVLINARRYAVIGVMPRGYDFPAGAEVWAPLEPTRQYRTAHSFDVVGRLRDETSIAAAQQDLRAIARRLKEQYGDDENMADVAVRPILEQLVGNTRPALTVLLGASAMLLLVACVNAANLMLARALARDRESAIRLALGAGPARLARLFMAESLVLSLAAAALGLATAFAGVPALLARAPVDVPRIGEIGVDLRVLLFSLGVSALVALAVGTFPALRAARRAPRDAMADGERGHGGSASNRRLRASLVTAQVSLTAVLLVGAGLVGRSVLNLLAENPGYRTEGALVMDVWLSSEMGVVDPRTAFSEGDARIVAFLDRLMEQLRATPGVERVGGVDHFPLGSAGANGTFIVLDRPDEVAGIDDWARLVRDTTRTGMAQFRVASADYFGAMAIPLLRGRLFDERDTRAAPHVALISASLANQRWPNEDPLGKIIQYGGMDGDLRPFTIVGIVGDIQEAGIGTTPQPMFYADYRQRPRRASTFHVVMQGPAEVATLTAAARRIAADLDPQVPVAFTPLREVLFGWLADRRFILVLLALFGGLALVLATTGVYGVTSYMALKRTREIGIRVALGARRSDLVGLVLRESIALGAAGVAIGFGVALVLTRVLSSWLYGVGRADPSTFSVVGVVLIVAALGASLLPAWRASHADAMTALRHD